MSEHQEQCAVIEWAQLKEGAWPELRLLHAIPNGGLRNKTVAMKLKAEGVKAGVPDLCLPVARDNYHGLYIEMKSHNGKVQPSQKKWLDDLAGQGYLAIVCWSAEEAIETIEEYLSEN